MRLYGTIEAIWSKIFCDNDNEKNQPKTQGCVWTPIKSATPGICF